MSVLSSSTTAVHTFGRLTSNCAIRAGGRMLSRGAVRSEVLHRAKCQFHGGRRCPRRPQLGAALAAAVRMVHTDRVVLRLPFLWTAPQLAARLEAVARSPANQSPGPPAIPLAIVASRSATCHPAACCFFPSCKTSRVHHAARRRGRMAAHGERAADAMAADHRVLEPDDGFC